MPDHVHLLVGVGNRVPLPAFVGTWKSLCSHARRARGRSGRFWQRSFFDRALRDNEPIEDTVLYILGNPVRKGLVATIRDYPLSGSFEFDL